ncbi:MAG: hypothetical protein ETSY1_24545 [Candidatus Entotheonella factor]|uniref:RNA polymerase sigma-70 region 2 domain-containing protein n=1 Tax=Entotheonella factor TaxID=1429438 RepID=W4LFU3_ENTF1|nr:sigma factor [Candidatus Entotheonella palauensis]ETW96963.1 MAG: hypothetical protein ETSY1_24545 [Candidatus Entotheonella factor]
MAGKPQFADLNHPDFLKSIKRRDPLPWTQLYERMQADLYAFFRNKLPACDEHEIDDCIIEVFSRAYADIQTFQAKSSLQSWLMNFARFVVRDMLKAVPQ